MTNKIISVLLILFCVSCSSRVKLTEPVHLSYSNRDVRINIEITHRSRYQFKSGTKFWYSFYGIMNSDFVSNKKPKEIRLRYKKEESQFYLDTIASTAIFRERLWREGWTRKDRIYIVFGNPNINWNEIKFIEIEQGKEFEHDLQ